MSNRRLFLVFLPAFIVGLFILQAMPLPGIFLMMFGAGILDGALVHVFIVSVFLLALVGSIPRFIVIVPIVLYSLYYAAYLWQQRLIERITKEVTATKIERVIQFDNTKHSIYINTKKYDDDYFLRNFSVPAVYLEENGNFRRRFLVPKDKFFAPNNNCAHYYGHPCLSLYISGYMNEKICKISFDEDPPHEIISISQGDDAGQIERLLGIDIPTVDVSLNNVVIAHVRDVKADKLPAFPFLFLGCGLVDNPPAWTCAAEFWTTHIDVKKPFKQAVARSMHDMVRDVVPTLLGLEQGDPREPPGSPRYEENASAYRACDERGEIERTPAYPREADRKRRLQ